MAVIGEASLRRKEKRLTPEASSEGPVLLGIATSEQLLRRREKRKIWLFLAWTSEVGVNLGGQRYRRLSFVPSPSPSPSRPFVKSRSLQSTPYLNKDRGLSGSQGNAHLHFSIDHLLR